MQNNLRNYAKIFASLHKGVIIWREIMEQIEKQELDEQPISNNQLFAKLCEVEKLLITPKVEKGLWTIQDIADYMGFSYGHVFKNIIPDPRFPAPVDIESRTNKDPKKLFVSEEVKAFFTRHKRKKYT